MTHHGKLAISGGSSAITEAFPSKLLGASLIGDEEMKQLQEVVGSQTPFRYYGLNEPVKVDQFEKEFRDWVGCRYALAVSSGTAALMCALTALGIGPGDEVIVPSFGWYSDFHAVVHTGALPVMAGIDDTLGLSPAEFERRITERTKAVIVIHYQGGAAHIREIVEIARRRGIHVIEDCAQALGAEVQGRKVGLFGDIAITSFQANKMITCGEGGMVYTGDSALFLKAVRYHDLGLLRPVFEQQVPEKDIVENDHPIIGMQLRMSELSGAFLLAQLNKLPSILDTCRNHHARLRQHYARTQAFELRPTGEGDCGITFMMKFATPELAARFSACIEAEGVPVGASSGCSNLLEKPVVVDKRQFHPDLPPFGEGYLGEHADYRDEQLISQTNELVSRYVAVGIGPLYTQEHMDKIIQAMDKVLAADWQHELERG